MLSMTTDQKLPSDSLKKATSPRKIVLIAGLSVLLVGGLGTAAFAVAPTLQGSLNHPTTTATVAPVDTVVPLTDSELSSVQQAADAQQAQIAADQQAAADAAAAQAAADAAAQAAASRNASRQANPGGLPSGAVVPLNSFGSPDTTKCASSSASDNADGVAVCD